MRAAFIITQRGKKEVMKQLTAEKVIETVRQYVGLKYRTQGRDMLGLDCGGVVVLVCRELGVSDADLSGYSNSPDGESFERILSENLDEVTPKESVRIGDIIAMDYDKGVQHTAFVTAIDKAANRYTVIHAKREKGVIEQFLHGYDLRAWTKTFRIKEIKYEEL